MKKRRLRPADFILASIAERFTSGYVGIPWAMYPADLASVRRRPSSREKAERGRKHGPDGRRR